MLCSKLHYQKGFNLILLSYEYTLHPGYFDLHRCTIVSRPVRLSALHDAVQPLPYPANRCLILPTAALSCQPPPYPANRHHILLLGPAHRVASVI